VKERLLKIDDSHAVTIGKEGVNWGGGRGTRDYQVPRRKGKIP